MFVKHTFQTQTLQVQLIDDMVEPSSVHAFGIGESLFFMLTKALWYGTAFDIFYDTIDAADFKS